MSWLELVLLNVSKPYIIKYFTHPGSTPVTIERVTDWKGGVTWHIIDLPLNTNRLSASSAGAADVWGCLVVSGTKSEASFVYTDREGE